MAGQSHPQKQNSMAKNEAPKTPRKPRQPRVLTQMEIDAKQNLADAQALARLLPKLSKLSTIAKSKLIDQIQAMVDAE